MSSQASLQTARVLFDERDAAELAERGVTRLLGRHAAGDVLIGLHREVLFDIAIELVHHPASESHERASWSAGRMMRAMARANRSQRVLSTSSCFLPFDVSR